ncbi:MAG: M48 family metalloprotease [Thermodesulfovibrionales bacterium]|nr:M48 family metalloprotease [Thermodesulfovibrionales bacterium]
MSRVGRLSIVLFVLLMVSGCLTTSGGGLSGGLSTAVTAVTEISKASRPISDEEEYYVGRALAARILTIYKLVNNAVVVDYVNLVGLTLSYHSDKPNTYGGYHFAILDTMEKNAFACPGGLIFITKGMLLTAKNEDELAAILAHEIAHINSRDGISAISSARWTEALTVIGTTAAKQYGSPEFGKLVSIFEGSIEDVFKTIVVNGYSQQQEFSADERAVEFLRRAGYNPSALHDVISTLNLQGAAGGGIMKTHPSSSERLERLMTKGKQVSLNMDTFKKRSDRFRAVIKKL